MKQELLLSEAIILGSAMRRQIKHKFDDGKGGACATGMAVVAGCEIFTGERRSFRLANANYWAWREAVEMPCACKMDPRVVIFAIAHMNDAHEWTPLQIAEWVAGIEKRLGLSQQQAHVAPVVNQQPVAVFA